MSHQGLEGITRGTILKVRNYGFGLDGQECVFLGMYEPSSGELAVEFSKCFSGITHNLSGRLVTNTGRWIPPGFLQVVIKEWD